MEKIKTDPTCFAHLHVHDEYSLLDGFACVDEYVDIALKEGWKYVAITNHGLLGGIPKQSKMCEGKVIPIFGCEVYVNDHREYRHYNLKESEKKPLPDGYESLDELRDLLKQNYHLTLLVKNEIGFKNLLNITSDGWINGFYRRPHVTRDFVVDHKEGLIAGTACMSGLVSKEILEGNFKLAEKHLTWFKDTFDDFFVEIMLLDIEGHDRINIGLIELMEKLDIDPYKHLVITNDSHYANKTDSFFQNVMLLLQRKQTFEDKKDLSKNVFQFDSLDLWYKTVPEFDEMYLMLIDKYPSFGKALTPELYKQAKLNTAKYASLCENVVLDKTPKFPKYCPQKNEKGYDRLFKGDSDLYLKHLTHAGLREKGFDGDQRYLDRVDVELDVIRKKNFSDYFLIVRDFVRFAKEQNIAVGPGRGSAAGSLLCYCLGITDVDPIRHKLFFERFLNEGRQDIPDIDIDFAPYGRDIIKQYIVNLYDNVALKLEIKKKIQSGFYDKNPRDKNLLLKVINEDLEIPEKYKEKRTCFIGTYGSFQTKTTLLDVCRAYGVPLYLAKGTSKKLMSDIDELDIDEIFQIKEYRRLLSILDIKSEKSEYCFSQENDIKGKGRIAKHTLLSNLDITEDNAKILWKKLIKTGVIDKQGCVLDIDKIDDEIYQNDLTLILENANRITPLESILKIRNRQKNISQHAAGVVISSVDLKNNLPLMTKGDLVLSSWIEGLKASELSSFGFVKWDLLGLLNLIYIEDTIKLINKRYEGKPFKRHKSELGNKLVYIKDVNSKYIDAHLEDEEVYKDFKQGKSSLIFQFESSLMRKLLKDSACDSFECLTAITALGRPGPLQSGMTEEFCLRKKGLSEYTIPPILEDTLSYSYGIVVYQEQIMQIVNILAGYSLAETDNFRKVLIKVKKNIVDENAQKLEKYKEKFLEGGQRYMSLEDLEKLFDDFLKWASYGFNRCLSGDTIVYGSTEISIKQLYNIKNHRYPAILSLSGDEIKNDSIKNVIYSGKQSVYKIQALYSIKATLKHRFLSVDGWKKVSDFKIGELIAVNQNGKPYYTPIESIEYVGEEDTYDIEMCGDEHNFIANGFVSHNSHAVSYTIVSYRCAWLKTYFPLEYICSVLQNTNKGDVIKQGRRTNRYEDYIHEAQRLGISIEKVDINKSEESFSVENEKTIRMGFATVKGITENSCQSILSKRVNPFESFNDFLNRLNKHPKRVILPLILVGVFDNLPIPVGRIEAYLYFAQKTRMDLGKEYLRFFKDSEKNDLSKKMAIVIQSLAIYLHTRIECLTPKFVGDMDIESLNFGKITKIIFDDDEEKTWNLLLNKGYIDEFGRCTDKYYNEELKIGLSEEKTQNIKQKINNIKLSSLELTKEENEEFFADIFGFSLDHKVLDKKIGIAKHIFNSKINTVIGIRDIGENYLKKIMEIKEEGVGRGIGLLVDFEDRLTKRGDPYCVITLEDGYGEDNRLRVFCWGEAYKQYGKLLDIRDPNDKNRIKHKDQIIYFDVIQDKNFLTFTPNGCPSFFKFGINKKGDLHKDALMFISALRKLREKRLITNVLLNVQDVIGYKIELDDDIDVEQIESLPHRDDDEKISSMVEGIEVCQTAQIIGFIAGIRECVTESKKKHADVRVKRVLKWLDLEIGDYTGSFDIRVWKSVDHVGEKEVIESYNFNKKNHEKKQDEFYEKVKLLECGSMVKIVVERLEDYRIFFGDDKPEVLKKTFVLKKIEVLKDKSLLFKNYQLKIE